MLRKTFYLVGLTGAVFGLCGCEYIRNHTAVDIFTGKWAQETKEEQTFYENNISFQKKPVSVVVCRSHQCAPAKLSMSKEYIYNSLLQLFDNNNYQKALVCQADPQTHTCLEDFITLPMYVGIVPTNAYIDHAKITDVIAGGKGKNLNIILNYNVTYGGQIAECTPAQSLLFARSVDHVILEDAGYNCKMTTIGLTNVKSVLAIDYIDLDYGYIGGNYSIGFSGPAYGGGTGYMLLRLPKNAYPLSPALSAPKKSSASSATTTSTGTDAGGNGATYSNGVQIFPLTKK